MCLPLNTDPAISSIVTFVACIALSLGERAHVSPCTDFPSSATLFPLTSGILGLEHAGLTTQMSIIGAFYVFVEVRGYRVSICVTLTNGIADSSSPGTIRVPSLRCTACCQSSSSDDVHVRVRWVAGMLRAIPMVLEPCREYTAFHWESLLSGLAQFSYVFQCYCA